MIPFHGSLLIELHLFLLDGMNESKRCTDENVVFLAKMRSLSLGSSGSLGQHANLELSPNAKLLDLVKDLLYARK
jgi:hypothetical protein